MSLEWGFKILDEMSSPLAKAGAALKAHQKTLEGVEKELKRLEIAERHAAIQAEKDPHKKHLASLKLQRDMLKDQVPATQQSTGAMLGFGAALGVAAGVAFKAIDVVAGIGKTALETAFSFGKMALEATEAHRAAKATLEVLAGGPKQGAALFEYAKQMDQLFGAKGGTSADVLGKLLGSGFDAATAKDALSAAFDVGSLKGAGTEAAVAQVEKFVAVLQKMKAVGSGPVEAKEIFTQAGEMGISRDQIIKAYSALHEGMPKSEVEAAIKNNQISGTQMTDALLRAVDMTLSKGGGLGKAAMDRAAASTTAQGNRIASAWENLFANVKTDGIAKFLGKIADKLQEPATLAAAEKFTDLLGRVFDKLGQYADDGTLSGLFDDLVDGAKGFAKALEKAAPYVSALTDGFVKSLGPALKTVAPTFESFMESTKGPPNPDTIKGLQAIGSILAYISALSLGGTIASIGHISERIGAVSGAIASAGKQITAFTEDLINRMKGSGIVQMFSQLGGDIVDGLIGGIKAGWTKMLSDFDDLIKLLPEGVRKALGMRSPSRVMMELGENASKGFEIGVKNVDTQGALASLMTPPSNDVGSAAGFSGGTFTIGGIYVTVQGGATPEETGRRVAEEANREIERRMLIRFEEMARAV